MSIDGVGDSAVEVERDTCRGTVGGHQSSVFLHFFFGVVVFGFFVPFFVLEKESYRFFMFVSDNRVVKVTKEYMPSQSSADNG